MLRRFSTFLDLLSLSLAICVVSKCVLCPACCRYIILDTVRKSVEIINVFLSPMSFTFKSLRTQEKCTLHFHNNNIWKASMTYSNVEATMFMRP